MIVAPAAAEGDGTAAASAAAMFAAGRRRRNPAASSSSSSSSSSSAASMLVGGSASVVAVAALAMGFAALLLTLMVSVDIARVDACSTTCTSTDSDDSCLFCAGCGLCEDYGITTRCNQPGTAHLTIDDGPFDTSTVALDILKWKNVSASFFLLGSQIAGREAIVQRMVREGHNIGGHSWDHSGFNQLATNIPNQMAQTTAEILRATNLTVTDFRPPFGECNKQCMQALEGWNMRLWNLDTLDYTDSMTTLKAQVDNTMAGYDLALSGWVIGMHLRSNLGLCALPALIDRVRSRGYTFVTADQCWGASSRDPIPGVMTMPSRVGIPPECNPSNAPIPLAFGACSASVGCWTPKGCCSQYGFCSTSAADCGSGCKGGWCNTCQGWIVQAPNPPTTPNTAWPSCTTTSQLFINACTSSPNGGCNAANTKECVMTGTATRTCQCHPGWTGTTCATNINECATNNGGCASSSSATCTDQTPTGSNGVTRTCTCRDGYTGDGLTCTDINECATGNGGCAAEATCTNYAPSSPFWKKFTCSACPAGFNGTGQVGTTCAPINECATNNGGCSTNPLVTCTDLTPTPSTPTALFQCGACPSGFAAAANNTCRDINECASANGGCSTSPPVSCYNTVGSFFCAAAANCTVGFSQPSACGPACPSGYSGDGKVCNDINECATDNGGCHHSSVCTNLPGSRTCGPCRDGYLGDGITCDDINECATNNGGCPAGSPVCTNAAPALANNWNKWTCSACPPGYTGTVGSCIDINECSLTGTDAKCSSDPATTCYNTAGSYYCAFGSACPTPTSCPACPPGYATLDLGKTCLDINECATNNGNCFAGVTCLNSAGAFHCGSCPAGMNGDGTSCANINECATANGGCDAGVTCTDLTPNAANSWLTRVCGECPGGYTDAGTCAVLDCSSNPCHNGGTCAAAEPAAGVAFTCTCASGFQGRTCELLGTPTPPSDAETSSSSSNSDSGRIASITVPTLIGGLMVLAAVVLCVRHRRNNSKPAAAPAAAAAPAGGAPSGPVGAPATAAPTPAHSPAARPVNITVPKSPEVAPIEAPVPAAGGAPR